MKANRAQVDRALARPAETRLFFFYGPDEAGSRDLARKVGAALGADAERVDLSGAELKSDPARLSDEAASFSMFGGARWILVEQAGDEIMAAVEALLDAPVAGNPVAIVAGALKATSKLVKLVLASPDAMVLASYLPDAGEADRLVAELGRPLGLSIEPDLARRIGEAFDGNRALIGQELAKLALYLDAGPEQSRPLSHEALEAVGVLDEEGDVSALVEAVMSGDGSQLDAEIGRLRAEGQEGITLIRALLRRLHQLARFRADVDNGKNVSAVMASAGKSLFWKDKPRIEQQVARWTSPLLAKAITRLIEAEAQVMQPGGAGIVAADAEMFTLCRQAARRR